MQELTEELCGGEGNRRDGPVVPQLLSKETKQTVGNGLSARMAWKKDAPNCLEACAKICRKLLLLQTALSPAWCQCESESTSRAQLAAAAQLLWLWRGANSRQQGKGCHFGKVGTSRSVLLGIHVLRVWRKPWFLISEVKGTVLYQ